VVMLVGDRDCIGCFADQVKLTHALIRDLDETVKEVKLLGEHEEESSQKITELDALCKRLREDVEKLKKEKTKLEGMVESRDELIMKITKEIGLDRKGEDAKAEDDDDDDGGDAATSPVAVMPPLAPAPPAATVLEEIVVEEDSVEMVPEQEAPMAHEEILADAKPEMSQPRLYCTLMRDYEESPSRMVDDLDDLDDPIKASSDMDEWFLKDGSNDRE
jgi:hypothetical protein